MLVSVLPGKDEPVLFNSSLRSFWQFESAAMVVGVGDVVACGLGLGRLCQSEAEAEAGSRKGKLSIRQIDGPQSYTRGNSAATNTGSKRQQAQSDSLGVRWEIPKWI